LGERGTFVQYTYGVLSPLHRRDFGLEGTVAQRVWRNLPPAAVWRFNRRAGIGAIAAPA
jgi:phosphatidylethanolamine/phosphatidyl-N-methylethanolamine N-methyltransferase